MSLEFWRSAELLVPTPYFKFPSQPTKIEIQGHQVYDYISPEQITRVIENISSQVRLSEYAAVGYNRKGGKYLLDRLVKLQGYKGSIFEIEYHRSKNGYGADVVQGIPAELANEGLGIVEDVWDSGGVFKKICDDAPHATCIALVRKIGIPNQIIVPNVVIVGAKTDIVWLGGCGMNMDCPGDGLPKDFLRDYDGIAAKIL